MKLMEGHGPFIGGGAASLGSERRDDRDTADVPSTEVKRLLFSQGLGLLLPEDNGEDEDCTASDPKKNQLVTVQRPQGH